jgi:hypothetical protein
LIIKDYDSENFLTTYNEFCEVMNQIKLQSSISSYMNNMISQAIQSIKI